LVWYYLLVGAYFFAFGLQFVLYPSLVTFLLQETPERVGLAQMAISAPMFCLLLIGGVMAERARPAPTLALLQLGFAMASLALSLVIAAQALTYAGLIFYAVTAGAFAAFVMPLRDAALNGVLQREAALGRHTSLATAAAATTAVQIGAQIGGIVTAQFAGGDPAPLASLQAISMAIAAGAALMLRAPKPTGHERTLVSAVRDVGAGLAYAFRNPVMSPMLISAAYTGVFIVGAFQVLFPLIVRDAYGGDAQMQAGRLSALLTAFWSASFVSAAVLSRVKPLRKPGRALIISHLIGAAALYTFSLHKPFWLFIVIVALWGLAAGVTISTSRTIVQSVAEPGFLGRVLAVYSMGFMGGAPIGSALVGFAAGEFGPRSAALIPAIGLFVAASALALMTPLWRMKSSAVFAASQSRPPQTG
jgi:MFS family permease